MRKDYKALRQNSIMLKLNDRELKALQDHCLRYGIENRSRWIRELMMEKIMLCAEQDSPLLFSEEEMR